MDDLYDVFVCNHGHCSQAPITNLSGISGRLGTIRISPDNCSNPFSLTNITGRKKQESQVTTDTFLPDRTDNLSFFSLVFRALR